MCGLDAGSAAALVGAFWICLGAACALGFVSGIKLERALSKWKERGELAPIPRQRQRGASASSAREHRTE